MDNLMIYCLPAIPIVVGVTKGVNTKLKEVFNIDSKQSKEVATLIVTLFAVLYYAFEISEENDIVMFVIAYIVIYIGASGIYQFTPKNKIKGGQTPINNVLKDEEEK